MFVDDLRSDEMKEIKRELRDIHLFLNGHDIRDLTIIKSEDNRYYHEVNFSYLWKTLWIFYRGPLLCVYNPITEKIILNDEEEMNTDKRKGFDEIFSLFKEKKPVIDMIMKNLDYLLGYMIDSSEIEKIRDCKFRYYEHSGRKKIEIDKRRIGGYSFIITVNVIEDTVNEILSRLMML